MQLGGVDNGREVELAADGARYHLSVKLVPTLPKGTAGVLVDLPGFQGAALTGKHAEISV